jgi:raffinose/stachyose/melibiose transport system permease protein
MIYNKDLGFLNRILRGVHLEGLIRPYLDDPKIVMTFVSIPIVWQYIGLYMLVFLTGYQSIDPAIFEVAQLDGVGPIVRAFKITLPLLSSTFKVALMLCVSGNMKVFDHIFVMTGGGPGRSSMVMAMYAYNQTFEMFKLGYASAISTAIMILSFAVIGASRLIVGRDAE